MANKLKIINDPVFGFLSIPNELIYDVLQHPYVQRLNRIRQLGLSYLVYPGAMHSRFGHSLGNPSSDQHRMKLLCAAHQIFDPAIQIGVYKEGGNEFVDVITSATLQGFSPVSIPDFIFIATIDGGTHGELVTCCERQTVIQARFMILGIQLAGLGAMVETTGKNAKQMVKQILDYLLIADPTKIADCSLVFDNGEDPEHPGTYLTGGGDHLWDNPVNWGPNHGSLIPSPFHAVRIEQPCKVNITDAHASSARLALILFHPAIPLSAQRSSTCGEIVTVRISER